MRAELLRRLPPLLLIPAALSLSACGVTRSTEVGVRTGLFGILEKRGESQVYEPGGVYFFLPLVNHWTTLPISQQNLLMNANPEEGDRPVPDEITFKTKDGNNVHIDVNLMWRIDPEQQKNIVAQKKSELEAKRAQWNQQMEDALGATGRLRNEADAYYQTKTNETKAVVAVAQPEAEGVRKEAEALSKLGGDAYVKMQVSQLLAKKHIVIVPTSNVSTMDVNKMVDFLLGRQAAAPAAAAPQP